MAKRGKKRKKQGAAIHPTDRLSESRSKRGALTEPENHNATGSGLSKRRWLIVALLAAAVAAAVAIFIAFRGDGSSQDTDASGREPGDQTVERLSVRIVERYPHQLDAFTQGLLFEDGVLYESIGQLGQSSLRSVDLKTGRVLRQRNNDRTHFAEGLALAGDFLIQLTWRNQRALVFRKSDFEPVREHAYKGEGWGLCFNGTQLVMSDGTDQLTLRDPATFAVHDIIDVTLEGNPITRLNELECVEGSVWANIWKQDQIVRINPRTGRVTAVVDASGLLTQRELRGRDVLNGIAWLPKTGNFLLTGKYWPWLFEVQFVPSSER